MSGRSGREGGAKIDNDNEDDNDNGLSILEGFAIGANGYRLEAYDTLRCCG